MNMKKQTLQTGSAHVIIVAVLVVALVGVLGWVLWQNFYRDKEVAHTPVTKDTSKSTTGQKKEFCIDSADFCFDYPVTWNVTPTKIEYPGKDSEAWKENGNKAQYTFDGATVTSPDGKVVLSAATGIGQIGGLCPDDVADRITVLATDKLDMTVMNSDGTSSPLYAVKSAFSDKGAYKAGVFLTIDSELATPGGYTNCQAGYADLFNQKNPVSGFGSMRFSSYDFFDVSPSGRGGIEYATLAEAKSALAEDPFKSAYAILTSVHYKE